MHLRATTHLGNPATIGHKTVLSRAAALAHPAAQVMLLRSPSSAGIIARGVRRRHSAATLVPSRETSFLPSVFGD